MSMEEKLKKVRDTLLTISDKVSHRSSGKMTEGYIVWAEDNAGGTLWGDGKLIEQNLRGTIDYYTSKEYDDMPGKIQNALNNNDISFYIGFIGRDEKTELIHYEWIWEVY